MAESTPSFTRGSAPPAAFQILTTPFQEPEAMLVPSGLNSIVRTVSRWARRDCSGFPVTASHRTSLPSSPPEAIREPEGSQATAYT